MGETETEDPAFIAAMREGIAGWGKHIDDMRDFFETAQEASWRRRLRRYEMRMKRRKFNKKMVRK